MNAMPKLFIFSCLVLTVILLVLIQQQSVPSIQYFPPDKNIEMKEANTQLTYLNSEDEDHLTWSIYSNTSEKAYLRQDISLLYVNGLFKGVLKKWKQNVTKLSSKKEFSVQHDAIIQAISFHHGETHDENNIIQSIQEMTNDQLYFLNTSTPHAFQEAQTEIDIETKMKIDEMMKKNLDVHWQQLITHFELDASDYTLIPLTDIITYQSQPIPNYTMEDTNRIIGQLWEGLYKKYVVSLSNKTGNHYMPILLLATDQSHLILLFDLDEEKQQYIQHIN